MYTLLMNIFSLWIIWFMVILLKPIWFDFSDRVAFNFFSYVIHKQYPHLNHSFFIGGFSLPLIGCWLTKTKLCTDRTTTYQRMKNSHGYSWLSKLGYFSKVYTCDKTIHTVHNIYSCSSVYKFWVRKYKATVHTILTCTKKLYGNLPRIKITLFFKNVYIIPYHILCK